ncbi:hypothetical protein AB0950_39870 [Streptomyces sp. NPDC007189]|uniref:hypothetical protein n=1 Tax=Streptomyces sp. NPDC007189 TaxID=3154315 RepID=UPI0034564556
MSAHNRLVGAATLKRLRFRRGWSLAGLARALIGAAAELGQPLGASVASVQRTVARWESRKAPILPGDRYQLLLAHLYARSTDGHTSLGTGSEFAELLDALAHLGDSERRLDELRTLLVRTATNDGSGLLALLGPSTQHALSAALADPSRLDEGLLADMRLAVGDVNGQVGSVPFVRVQLLLAPIVESCRRLLDAAVPEPLLPGLQSVAAQAFTIAGRAAFETHDDAAARALYAEATTAAGATGSSWHRAIVNMSHALVTLYSTPGIEAAQRLVDAAVRDARAGESVTVRARAHALQAEIAARAGAERNARAALALAWYDMDSDRDGDPASTSFSVAHLRGFEGVCRRPGRGTRLLRPVSRGPTGAARAGAAGDRGHRSGAHPDPARRAAVGGRTAARLYRRRLGDRRQGCLHPAAPSPQRPAAVAARGLVRRPR